MIARLRLPVVLLIVLIAAACLSPAPTPVAKATVTPSAMPAVRPPTPSPAPSATATPKFSPTPLPPVLAIPSEFVDSYSAAVKQLQQSQPGLRTDIVADPQTAAARLQSRLAAWAIVNGPQPPSARLLCLTPYVPVVHFSSPLEEISAQRLRAIFQGQDWLGNVFYSGDPAVMRRVTGMETFGANVVALPSWQAVIDRVAGDRTALGFVPWSEVQARVKTLAVDGRSIAVDGLRGYGIGDAWWLSGGGGAGSIADDIVARLACPGKEPVTFLAAGDMLMGWYVDQVYVKTKGPEYLFQRIGDLVRSADIAFGNFENPMSSGGVMENKGLMFRASPDAVKGLSYAGIDVVNLANNHIGDYGPQAVLDTLDTLRKNGIGYVGAGRNRSEARSPWITSTKGITIAILGYNEIEPGYFAATASRAGSAWIETDNVYDEIKKAKTQADFVIASFHWGIEYTPFPNSRQREIARGAAAAGAGLVVGHHPHVVQGLGFIGDVFVDYSIGDFVYSQPTRPATGEGIILRALIDGHTLKQVQLIPIYIDRAQPYVMPPVDAKLMMARIFDATGDYKGLPASTEQAITDTKAASLPQAAMPVASASLAAVEVSGNAADLVLLPAAAGAERKPAQRLTASGALNDAPAWSPDGKRIAYSAAGAGNVDIYIAAADGSLPANVTRNPAWDDYPAWSPDGTKIAFSSNRDGSYKIYLMNADGTGVKRLTAGDWDTTPAWSPDGESIAFASNRSGTFQIYTVGVDGSGLKQLSNYPNLNAFPAWSPDGKSIVYQSYQSEAFNHGDDDSIQDRDYEIMVVPSGGGAVRRLTDNTYADIQPRWSPDGKQIAFASDRSGAYQIWLMNADGSGAVAVTGGPQAHSSPAWAP